MKDPEATFCVWRLYYNEACHVCIHYIHNGDTTGIPEEIDYDYVPGTYRAALLGTIQYLPVNKVTVPTSAA